MMAAASFAGPILSRVWQFHAFSPQTLDTLVAHSMRETAPKGAYILHEGAAGCDAFVVIEGRLEVQIAGKNSALPVAVLTAGDLFGEVAIIEGTEVRTASVVALTPVTLLRIDGDTLREAIEHTPHTRAELSAAAHHMAVGRFIKSATLLGELPPEAVARLAQHVHERRVVAGDTVIERGEPGEECFLIRTGELEVLDDNGEVTRRIATLRTGMLFGETALLTGAPRNATVRATADSELLVLRRSDVLVAMASQADVADHLVALMQARSRPRSRPGMEFHERPSADGNAIYTLKDPARGTYFRLSREGAFVWSHLDGHHTLRDLTMALFIEYKILAPDVVMDVVRRLAADGFVELERLEPAAYAGPTMRERAVRGFVSFMEWSYTLKNCDAYFQAFYDRAGRYLNTRIAAIIGAIIAVGGFASFVAMAERSAGSLLHAATVWTVTLSMLPLIIVAIVLHEFAHGLAAKAAGARIDRVGLGWFWLRIILFVDTSDAWLATRRQRMLVDAAGILVNLVLAGIAGYVALLAPNKDVVAVAWVFALWSYVGVLRNLNPLLEYDGYFLLMDALERPNLRGKSLGWIATGLPVALKTRASLRGHRLELWYAFGAVVYIGIVTGWTLFAYRFTAQGWVARIFPPAWAPHIGHAFAFILGGLALFRLVSDIRTERAKLQAHARHALHKG
jgi:CRP-like cAMP-binding protein